MRSLVLLNILIYVVSPLYFQAQVDSTLYYTPDIPVEVLDQRSYIDQQVILERSHFLSYPGAFEDPARLMLKFPGFANSNDQANEIIYNGMPSKYTRWSIQGADIINPNHLSTAGTASGLSSPSGGGVNLFSAQLIKNLQYNSNPSSTPSNSIAGNAALELRDPYKNQWHINASLVGIELGKDLIKGNTEIIANYRYSTVGILTGLGADFGGEKINYQDAVLKIKQNSFLSGGLSAFLAWGNSINDVSASDQDKEELLVSQDLESSKLRENTWISGLKYYYDDNDWQLNLSSNFSSKKSDLVSNTEILFGELSSFLETGYTHQAQDQIWSNLLTMEKKNDWGNISFSNKLNFIKEDILFDFYELNQPYRNQYSDVIDLRRNSYIENTQYADLQFSNRWPLDLYISLGHHYQSKSKQNNWLASASLSKKIGKHYFSGKYNRSAQIAGLYDLDNSTTIGNHFAVGWAYQGDKTNFSFSYNNHRVSGTVTDYHYISQSSLFDAFKPFETSPLVNTDSLSTRNSNVTIHATNFFLEHYFPKKIYFSFTGTVLDHTEKSIVKHSSPTAPDYLASILVKKTIDLTKSKSLGISGSYYFRDAFRQKIPSNYTFLTYEFAPPNGEYLEIGGIYQRADFRMFYVKKTTNRKAVWSIDIQNIFSQDNFAFSRYNFVTDDVLYENQLGIIGILSYRLSF